MTPNEIRSIQGSTEATNQFALLEIAAQLAELNAKIEFLAGRIVDSDRGGLQVLAKVL